MMASGCQLNNDIYMRFKGFSSLCHCEPKLRKELFMIAARADAINDRINNGKQAASA
jgi:hypothetical protein